MQLTRQPVLHSGVPQAVPDSPQSLEPSQTAAEALGISEPDQVSSAEVQERQHRVQQLLQQRQSSNAGDSRPCASAY